MKQKLTHTLGEFCPLSPKLIFALSIAAHSRFAKTEEVALRLMQGEALQLLGNNNTDEAMILIDSCTFHSSTGAAIRTEKPTPGERGGSAWPASQPLRNRGTFSTQITVRDCKFIGCNQVLVSYHTIEL